MALFRVYTNGYRPRGSMSGTRLRSERVSATVYTDADIKPVMGTLAPLYMPPDGSIWAYLDP